MDPVLASFFDRSAARPWAEQRYGPILSLPDHYKEIKLNGMLFVEYKALDHDGQLKLPKKNHVVLQVPFADGLELFNPESKRQVRYRSARISMDLTAEDGMYNAIVEELYIEDTEEDTADSGFPGTVYVKLLDSDGPSASANKFCKFNKLKFDTLGEFLDFLVEKRLHQMCFTDYGGAWKGCRDFITQVFAQLCQAGKVDATDTSGCTFQQNITTVHQIDSNQNHSQLVEKGKFFRYERDDLFNACYQPEA